MTALLTPSRIDAATRRQVLGGAGALLLTAACGRDREPATTAPERGGFPRTIEHRYGSTTIPRAPQRVVTVGLSDHDPVLALGLKPAGVADWYGDYPHATWPWATDELGDATPQIVGDSTTLEFETIAALQPDVITGAYSGLTAGQYDTLSRIAPTVAQSGRYPDYGTPWQQMTRVIGRSVGREMRAEELIAGVENRFATAARRHPEFAGRTAVFVLFAPDGTYHAYASEDTRARFLTSFGFEVPRRIDELAGDSFYAEISRERLATFDGVDALVWDGVNSPPGEVEEIRNSPLYRRLDVAREGRGIFVQDEVALGAIAWSTVLSLPFAIDHLVPRLATAVDGDPGN